MSRRTVNASALVVALMAALACSASPPAHKEAVAPRPTAAVPASAEPLVRERPAPPPLLPLAALIPALADSVHSSPVLVPRWLPSGDLSVRIATDRGYQVTYWPPGSSMWTVEVGCFDGPDPIRMAEPNTSFHGVPAILARGHDTDDHLSLAWVEPGATGCRAFAVSAYGLSVADFWRLADSLTDL